LIVPFSVEFEVVRFQLAIPATAATNLPLDESAVVSCPALDEIAVAE
jgi:hypothetical protein